MDDKNKSRKWKLVKYIFFISSLAAFIPPIFSKWVFQDSQILILLPATSFVTLISIVVSAFFGFNVLQKNVYKNKTETIDQTIETKIPPNENGEM